MYVVVDREGSHEGGEFSTLYVYVVVDREGGHEGGE